MRTFTLEFSTEEEQGARVYSVCDSYETAESHIEHIKCSTLCSIVKITWFVITESEINDPAILSVRECTSNGNRLK